MVDREFLGLIMKFAEQTVRGSCCAVYRTLPNQAICPHKDMAITANGDKLKVLCQKYINDCWHDYHQKDDDFVVTQINKMLEFNLMTHPSCIFHWIQQISWFFIDCLKFYQRKCPSADNVDRFRAYLEIYLDLIAEHKIEEMLEMSNKPYHCSASCKPYCYKEGEDIII
jgi:hypothetical protein